MFHTILYFLLYYIARNDDYHRLEKQYRAGDYGRERVVQNDERHRRGAEQQPVYAAGEIARAVFYLHVALVLDLYLEAIVLFHLLRVPELRPAHAEDRAHYAGEARVDALREIREGYEQQQRRAEHIAEIPELSPVLLHR